MMKSSNYRNIDFGSGNGVKYRFPEQATLYAKTVLDTFSGEELIAKGLQKSHVDLIAYQWMSNHWHIVLSPQVDGGISAFIGWGTLTHIQRYHAHYRTANFSNGT